MSQTEEEMTQKMTPDEWLKELGYTVLDPDGWRTRTSPPFTEPITLEEFQRRFAASTVRPVRRK